MSLSRGELVFFLHRVLGAQNTFDARKGYITYVRCTLVFCSNFQSRVNPSTGGSKFMRSVKEKAFQHQEIGSNSFQPFCNSHSIMEFTNSGRGNDIVFEFQILRFNSESYIMLATVVFSIHFQKRDVKSTHIAVNFVYYMRERA